MGGRYSRAGVINSSRWVLVLESYEVGVRDLVLRGNCEVKRDTTISEVILLPKE
jgi:hypothetical protein